MLFVFDCVEHSNFNGLDYALVSDNNAPVLVLLPHGSETGKMYNRNGSAEMSEQEVVKLGNIILSVMSKKYDFNVAQCPVVAAPCYPNAVRNRCNTLEIIGDWDTTTVADTDVLGQFFVGSAVNA